MSSFEAPLLQLQQRQRLDDIIVRIRTLRKADGIWLWLGLRYCYGRMPLWERAA
jgi:hypothetical protein